MAYKLTLKPSYYEKTDKARFVKAGDRLVNAMLERARQNAPIKTGALRKSGRQTRVNLQWTVTFGGGNVPYARRREYENNLHPNTKYYLKRAGQWAAGQAEHYLKGL